MPKSKRDKKISLTRTDKKGMVFKQELVEKVKTAVDQYARIFVFTCHNMRNTKMKDVREEWSHSKFFFGKNKIISIALGKSAQDEYRENLHKISEKLAGQTGLLFTNKRKSEVISWFKNYRELDYSRSGCLAMQTVIIEEGPLEEFSHSMEPQLRKLGLPTELQKGIVTLTRDYTVCKKGVTLTPEQAHILKLFCHPMAEFQFTLQTMWSNNGKVVDIKSDLSTQLNPKVRVKGPGVETEASITDSEDQGVESVDSEAELIDVENMEV